ncbi:17952_t:CDS:1, partial [Dentiscutata erythropus]
IDEWSTPLKKSIYTFVIITPSRKQYIYSLVDKSSKFYTGSFNASEIEKILIAVGTKKFVAIVSDAESAMQLAKQIIFTKYS